MKKCEFEIISENKLIKAVQKQLPFLSIYQIESILKDKDVKVNGKRVKEDAVLNIGDKVEVFYNFDERPWAEIVFEDDNILVVNKKSGIEVVSETDRDLFEILKLDRPNIFAVHRIDRNTEGLVIFAKTEETEQELIKAFKERTVIKKYALKVKGKVNIDAIKPKMYLKKFNEQSKVLISEVKTSGYEEIVTRFSVVKYLDNETILNAELVTGKTHQIRAHIAYFGYPIVGDGKYGVADNKQMCLTAYYMAFNFPKKSCLEYLNDKHFEIYPSWI